MLREYIYGQLDQARKRVSDKKKEYKLICEKEKTILDQIENLRNHSNIDLEIFSPRFEEKSLHIQVNEYYSKLHDIQEQKSCLENEMKQEMKIFNQFKGMAAELLILEKKANVSRET